MRECRAACRCETGLETLKSGIEQMENALNASQTELDASGMALKQARTELEANNGQIDGYRTLVATMDSQITALQAQMIFCWGSKEWQTLNTQMQALLTDSLNCANRTDRCSSVHISQHGATSVILSLANNQNNSRIAKQHHAKRETIRCNRRAIFPDA